MIAPEARYERSSREILVAALESARSDCVRGTAVRCPFCDDAHPSGSIHQPEAAGGAWKYKCHRCGFCGDVYDVRARAGGKTLAETLPLDRCNPANKGHAKMAAHQSRKPSHVQAAREAAREASWATDADLIASVEHVADVYRYTDPVTGRVDLLKIRVEEPGQKKRFTQAHQRADGRWVKRKPEGRQPLFNRSRLAKADIVLVVEGEKACKALVKFLESHPDPKPSVTATTAPGGSSRKAAEECDWSPLIGKLVYLWPDNDPPDEKGVRKGLEYAGHVARELQRLEPPPELREIDVAGLALPPKGDAVEFLALGAGLPYAEQFAALEAVLAGCRPLSVIADLDQRVEDTIAGIWSAVPWPWPVLSQQTKSLFPGTVTVVCGSEGASKSFFALACCWRWLTDGHRVAYLALERERASHLQRLLAMLDGRWDILDDAWGRANPAELRLARDRHRKSLERFAPRINAPHTEAFSRKDALDWLKARCAEKCRVVVLDPVTALIDPGDIWTLDLDFVMRCRSEATATGTSVVFVTHPRTGTKGMSNSAELMAGGAAYRRFTDSVLWVTKCDGGESQVLTAGASLLRKHNRMVRMLKTRDGAGQGRIVAFDFGQRGPSLDELGLVDSSVPSGAGIPA